MNATYQGAVRRSTLSLIIATTLTATAMDGGGLPATTKSLDNLPEAVHGMYDKVGEDYVLQVDDSEYKKRIAEFRQNNIELLRKQDEMAAKLKSLEGIDPKVFAEMKKKLEEGEDQGLIDEGKIDELVEKRVERMRAEFESKVNALTSAKEEASKNAQQYKGKLENVLIDSQIGNAVSAAGAVRKGAMADVLGRARNTWKLDDNGNPVALNADGTTMYGSSGDKPLTMEEWSNDLVLNAPFLFEASSGGGSNNDERQTSTPNGAIRSGDRKAFGANLEGIAGGKVAVVSG